MNGATMEPGYTLILLQARADASCHTSNCADSKEELEKKAPRIYFHLLRVLSLFHEVFSLRRPHTHSHLSQWRCDA